MILTGWKDICAAMGMSVNTLKRLTREEDFPVQYVATRPVTTQDLVSEWLRTRLQKPVKTS